MSNPSVYILDTTLREGELNPGVYYTPEMLESIGLAIAELGTPRIEFSISYPQRGGKIIDLKNVTSSIHESYGENTIIIQCRAFKEDIEIAQKVDAVGCGVYIAISEEHRKNKLNGMSIDDVITRLTESLDLLREYGFSYRRAVLEDASRFFSKDKGVEDTLENFKKIINSVDEAGATTISMPDTAGLLEESRAIKMFEFARNFTDKELAAHFHNDYGNSLGNTIAVVKRGLAREAQVSIYGLGSGAGIADHYEVSSNLIDNLNLDTGEDRSYFQNLYRTFQAIAKIPIPWNHPLSHVARTEKAGTHQAQQLKSPQGYIPSKKLKYDFDDKIFFEFGRLTSKRLLYQLLKGSDVDEEVVGELAEVIGKRSAFLNRKLSSREIKIIIGEVANFNIPLSKISQYMSPEKAFYLLRVTPMVTTEITEKIENLEGVDRVLEAFGIYDIIVESYAHANMQRKIEELLGSDMIEIIPLIIG